MKRRLVYREGKSDKFWAIECVGASYSVTFGRTQTAGQTQTKSFASAVEARAAAEKATAEKLKKGYVDDTTGATTASEPAAAAAPSAPFEGTIIRGDHAVPRDQRETHSGDVRVDGWLELRGRFECEGTLECLGVSLECGAELRCRRLITNLLRVDNERNDTKLHAESIAARVVWLVQIIDALDLGQPLAALIAHGEVQADYIQQHAHDLNPSWSYQRGQASILRSEHLDDGDERDSERTPILELASIRQALSRGENPFVRLPLLVEKLADVVPPRRTASDPLLDELRAWIASHPGPQRRVAMELREAWVARLADAPAEVRTEAIRVVKSAIGSPKLKDEREAILDAILPPG